jgi:hypothetical protein
VAGATPAPPVSTGASPFLTGPTLNHVAPQYFSTKPMPTKTVDKQRLWEGGVTPISALPIFSIAENNIFGPADFFDRRK